MICHDNVSWYYVIIIIIYVMSMCIYKSSYVLLLSHIHNSSQLKNLWDDILCLAGWHLCIFHLELFACQGLDLVPKGEETKEACYNLHQLDIAIPTCKQTPIRIAQHKSIQILWILLNFGGVRMAVFPPIWLQCNQQFRAIALYCLDVEVLLLRFQFWLFPRCQWLLVQAWVYSCILRRKGEKVYVCRFMPTGSRHLARLSSCFLKARAQSLQTPQNSRSSSRSC